MSSVLIKKGNYRGMLIENQNLPLVKGYSIGAKNNYITVNSNGLFGNEFGIVRVKVDSVDDFVVTPTESAPTTITPLVTVESDDEVMNRIEQKFEILQQMTRAIISGDVRAMIVTGPPGVGKSYGVEYELEKYGLFEHISRRKIKYEVIKGAMSPIGLYCTLYKNSDPNNVLVFDDCDSVFQDELALNILKAALDSGKKRRIHWNSDSSMLRREGVPDCFDFKGGAIFITNLKFDHLKSKRMQDHLEALQSRCHFLDLTLDTMRDKFLRIKQIFRQGQLFNDFDLTTETGEEILAFMDANKNRLREMSLRMALKLADLTKVSEENWKSLAISTCMKI
jgi:hypothetical protein